MKVSVLMLAYNHERYIEAALESALGQQTTFEYEIVVGEDCSSDRTREILSAYRERHPGRIRLLLPERNLGMMGNFTATFRACRGEYIAILEGDDYWTSAEKLQRQADFLDSHPDFAECFHNAEIVVEGRPGENGLFMGRRVKASYGLSDVAKGNFIATCSVMLRRGLLPEFPSWFAGMPMADWPLHVLLAEKGELGYLPEVMAAYRVHGAGAWSGTSRVSVIERSVEAAQVINRHLGSSFNRGIKKSIAKWEREAAELLLAQGAHREAAAHAWRAARIAPQKHLLCALKAAGLAAAGS